MKERLEQRLAELEAEYENGQKALTDMEQRQAQLRATMLRIQGAVLVLKEELAKENNEIAKAKEILESGESGLQGLGPPP